MGKDEVKKEVVKKEEVLPAIYEGLMDSTPVAASDLLVPKILLMQGMSQLVTEGKAVFGEMRNSLDGSLMGNKDKPVEVILFKPFKTWIVLEEINGKYEFREQIPVTPQNEAWEWDAVENGIKIRRDKALNFFALLPAEIEKGMFFPYLISFRRTSYKAGMKLETFRAKYSMFKKPLSYKTFLLSCLKTENDKGVYYIFDVTEGRNATDSELGAVTAWKEKLEKSNVKIDDSDLKEKENTENFAHKF